MMPAEAGICPLETDLLPFSRPAATVIDPTNKVFNTQGVIRSPKLGEVAPNHVVFHLSG